MEFRHIFQEEIITNAPLQIKDIEAEVDNPHSTAGTNLTMETDGQDSKEQGNLVPFGST
jgi:hypothetical protein